MTRTSLKTTRLLGAAAGATALVLASGLPAFADTAPTPVPVPRSTCSADRLAYVKARVDLNVAHRELTISKLTSALAARTHVTDDHRATLTDLFTSDAAGLEAVDATVKADTTCRQAVTDGRTVVTDYRVYMLLVPQTHLVAASDTGGYGAARIIGAEPKLQAGIDAITDPTKKAQAQAAYDDLVAQAKAAADDFAGVGDAMLALKPADMPAARSQVTAERSKVEAGRSALTTALKDAKTIRGLLG